MKTIIIFTLLSIATCWSCTKPNENKPAGNLKLELTESKVETKEAAASSTLNTKKVIAVLDIKSYNAKTGEIIFNNNVPPEDVGKWNETGYKVNVYINDDSHLFTLIFSSPVFSYLYNEPVLYYTLGKSETEDISTQKAKWYILSGYPQGKILSTKSIIDDEQLKNFQKIESNWNVFIDDLKKSGKYIN